MSTISEHLSATQQSKAKPATEAPARQVSRINDDTRPQDGGNVVRLPVNADSRHTLDILVAEDNEVNQLVFDQILRPLDYAFRIVGNGRRAVETWTLRKPKLILMDVSMPEMNGFEATAAIREAEEIQGLQRTPIIGVTAHALKGDKERCLEAGMDDYITKPISPERMASKLMEWLGDKQARGVSA